MKKLSPRETWYCFQDFVAGKQFQELYKHSVEGEEWYLEACGHLQFMQRGTFNTQKETGKGCVWLADFAQLASAPKFTRALD